MTVAQLVAIVLLVSIEVVRFGIWALRRLGLWLDRVYERRRRVEAARQEAAKSQRAQLIDVGTHAKWGLLRQAGLVDGRKRDGFDERSA